MDGSLPSQPPQPWCITRAGFDQMLQTLMDDGVRVIGPILRDAAIVYDTVDDPGDLAQGWQVEATPGRYRLHKQGEALFDHVIGPTPWKQVLHPPRDILYKIHKPSDGPVAVEPSPLPEERLALIGIRACDLAALDGLDRVLGQGSFVDPRYLERRRNTLTIAVNCRQSAATCFCASMQTGPKATSGYDLCLSELGEGPEARFLVEIGSPAGTALIQDLPRSPATPEDLAEAERGADSAAAQQTRHIDRATLPEAVTGKADHAHWDVVADRCLNCSNCTMVCPTCFCTSVDEVSDLAGEHFERQQRWASCFTTDFSHIHGGAVRQSGRSRYRQWLTHKLGTWPAQFDGDLGCTGCGRCITWCPVGIDLTAELAELQKEPSP